MSLGDDVLPEEYVDIVLQEFAYDPIKLPYAEDFSQVLYNRRTLETIWDTRQDAINPYTRQPFHIQNVIPQTELKQQMREYLLNNGSVTICLGLEVVPDYTQILNEIEMKNLLDNLAIAGNQCLSFLKECDNKNRKPDEEELGYWKALWKKLNLVRLYCQYKPENRAAFLSNKGYEYLFKVFSTELLHSCHEYSGSPPDDAKEACKEVARIVDVMGGLNEKDLLMAPDNSVLALVRILLDVAHGEYLKIQSMVLRIYRGMFENCFYYLIGSKGFPICYYMVELAFSVLAGRDCPSDVVNEDLYNGMRILEGAWISSVCLFQCPHCVEIICMAVTVCISRLQELHDAVTAHEARTISSSNSHQDDHEDSICRSNITTNPLGDPHRGEVEMNTLLISKALDHGLCLIDSLLAFPHLQEDPHSYTSRKETLQSMDIGKQISRMVESVHAGNKFFLSSHLGFGRRITAAL